MWPFQRSRRGTERELGRALLTSMESRASIEDPRVPLSDPQALSLIFGDRFESAAGVDVTFDKALGVPAVWSAINFISGTFAALPAPVYRKVNGESIADDEHPVAVLLDSWVNADYLTSFSWRKQAMVNVLGRGRSYTFIERDRAGRVINLWPLINQYTTPERKDGRRRYRYQDGNRTLFYDVSEVIDIQFMTGWDGVCHHDPIATMKNSLGLAIALEAYASKFFQGGGVPPLAMQQPAGTSSGAAKRGSDEIADLLLRMNAEGRLVLPMPNGMRLEPVGFKPQDGQLVEARKLQILETARLYMLPPIFLQDLQFGTYTNTEQQDLILVKHTLTQWLRCWEQELNAKLFARGNNRVKFNVDALLRGDFTTRMNGHAKAIQSGIETPDEARDLEDRPRKGGAAEKLYMQGAMVPLGTVPTQPASTPAAVPAGETQ